jgi:kynurenine--oxoglutarate transaminase/cysteine-S-conjugate beta-lyase/glutamine--phenylpyruvate transaminase
MCREINPLNEILVTGGAYGSLFNALTGFLNENDEAIIIEPFFDCYAPMVVSAKSKCVYVPLKPKHASQSNQQQVTSTADWAWDDAELEQAFTSKTRLVIINTPNNPLGKVFTREELERLAQLCIKHNCICISDEVYEHLTYDRKHIRMATLPGMWERTVTVGSAGKTFSSTGSKVNHEWSTHKQLFCSK